MVSTVGPFPHYGELAVEAAMSAGKENPPFPAGAKRAREDSNL
jgi:hypothetical protein